MYIYIYMYMYLYYIKYIYYYISYISYHVISYQIILYHIYFADIEKCNTITREYERFRGLRPPPGPPLDSHLGALPGLPSPSRGFRSRFGMAATRIIRSMLHDAIVSPPANTINISRR